MIRTELEIDIRDPKILGDWLEKEDKDLSQELGKIDNANIEDKEEYFQLQLRYMTFINLWNFHHTVHLEEGNYICPKAEGPIPPIRCMFCPHGHMGFDCHWPYDCNSELCTHYTSQDPSNLDLIHENPRG
mgnify:CR=1 FL=1